MSSLALVSYILQTLSEGQPASELPLYDEEKEKLLSAFGSEEGLNAAWAAALDLVARLAGNAYQAEIVPTNQGPRACTPWAGPVTAEWLEERAGEHLAAAATLRAVAAGTASVHLGPVEVAR